MLPTNKRVKKELFPEIMKKGLFLSKNLVSVRYLDRKDTGNSLFSFVIPSKIVKTSVKRHQIKRKMSAIVEKEEKKLKKGLSVIFFLKKSVLFKDFNNLEKEILDLLGLLGYTQ